MHELSMARSIVDTVLEAAKQEGAEAVLAIELVIGKLTLLSPDQVEFWVGELLRGTIAEHAELTVEQRGPQVRCKQCGYEGAVETSDDPVYHLMTHTPICPDCGSKDLAITAGDECMIRNIRARR